MRVIIVIVMQTTFSGESRMCMRRGVNHILAKKKGVNFTFFLKLHENAIFSLMRWGGGRKPATPYAGSATDLDGSTSCFVQT